MKIIQCTESHLEELIFVAKQSFIDAFEKQTEPSNFKAYMSKAFTTEGVLEELQHPESAFFFLQTDEGETTGYVKLRWDRSEEFSQPKKQLNYNAFICLKPIGIKVLEKRYWISRNLTAAKKVSLGFISSFGFKIMVLLNFMSARAGQFLLIKISLSAMKYTTISFCEKNYHKT